MNQDLENYIKQARSSGQTDEQIKQALKSNGWQEADINQAFGGQSPTPEIASVATKSWLTGRIIAIVIALLVIAGGTGAYFFLYSKKLNNDTPYKPGTDMAANEAFNCRDLVSDAKFQAVTQKNIADYQLVEEGNGLAVAGLNRLQQGLGDQVNNEDVKQVVCGYVANGSPYKGSAIYGEIIYVVTWSPQDEEVAFNRGRQVMIDVAIQLKIESPVDIQGIGLSAYHGGADSADLNILSTNKKYMIHVGIDKDVANREIVAQELGKAIDESLSNY